MQVSSAWLILLLPIGWLTLGKWCWLALTICAIFPLLGGLLSVFVSKCISELQLLWIRMLCYILLRSYIQCCTLNWINLMYGLNHIPFGLIYFTYGLHSLIYGQGIPLLESNGIKFWLVTFPFLFHWLPLQMCILWIPWNLWFC